MLNDVRTALEQAAVRLGPFAGRLTAHESIGSTNDEAARLAGLGAAEGTVVVAEAQTSGRGRSGRNWFSPPGAGLYVSIVLRPAAHGVARGAPGGPPSSSRFITLAAGVAIAEGILAATALPVELKWPNDIVVREGIGRGGHGRWRKLAGILTEASATGTELHHVVVGFGINVRPAVYPPALAAQVTSLEAESGRTVDRARLLVEALAALWTRYTDLREGREGHVLERWRALSPAATGARVTLLRDGATIEGVTMGLTDAGALAIRLGTGDVEPVISGEVRWI
jgi:BirA family biotin operon repressor/biotin-[acetyl-CoA-carboxylase] ligase